jgi:hypothetical protein
MIEDGSMLQRRSLRHVGGQLALFAPAAPTGVAIQKLGETPVSHGRYPSAIAAFTDGLKKSGLKSPDDAKFHLGVPISAQGASRTRRRS